MILVTGIFGHIGYTTTLELCKHKNKVIGIYNNSVDINYKKILIKNNVTLIKNNLTNFEYIKKIFKKHKIKKVVHCAAVAHDSIAKKEPLKTLNINSISVYFFLELLKQRKFNKFIYISTGSVFQNITDSKKIFENKIPTPKSLYATTKRLGEVLTQSYKENFNLDAFVLRVSWVYGPPLIIKKINPQRGPIPYIAYKIAKGQRNIKFSSGKDFKAAFTYIKDVNNAVLKLLNSNQSNICYFHLSGGKNYSNIQIGKIFEKIIIGSKITFKKGVKPWSNDSVMRPPIVSNNLKYKIKYSLEKGISEYIKFLINHA